MNHNAHTAASVLVVDDEPDLRTLYEMTLVREGYQVETAASLAAAREQLQAQHFDVVLADMRLPDGLGMDLLHELRAQHRAERCVVVTAYGSAQNAVEALRAGAFDYLSKPVDLKQFRIVVASAARGVGGVPPLAGAPGAAPVRAPGKANPSQKSPPPEAAPADAAAPASTVSADGMAALNAMVGNSAAMQAVKQRIAKAARGMAPVFVHGESGTGKELVARALHACSPRADGPLVAVNCGAIPENLLEAEFFGARKGSYTGLTQDRIGYFQAARGGTLFLDEIGDLPLPMQTKLLRAIQERRVRPLGTTQEEAVDVRIVSATHRNLAAEVQAGRFRQDLYYRLNVIEVQLPPLRERREDLPALTRALLARLARESGLPIPPVDDCTLAQIAQLPLPGNVRELENLLYRAIALADADAGALRLDDEAASSSARAAGSAAVGAAAGAGAGDDPAMAPPPAQPPHDLQAWLDAQERTILERTLRAHGFDHSATAERLGLNPRQVRARIKQLGIEVPQP